MRAETASCPDWNFSPATDSEPPAIDPQFGGERSAAEQVERLRTEHRRRGVEIDAATAVTGWQGERMDYSTAIDGLLRRDGVVELNVRLIHARE